MQMVVEKAIKQQVNSLDTFLYQVKQDADAAAQQVIEDPSQAPTIYARYVKAVQNRLALAKQTAEQQVLEREVNVAIANDRNMSTQNDDPYAHHGGYESYTNHAHAGTDPNMHNHFPPAGFAEHNDMVCITCLRLH